MSLKFEYHYQDGQSRDQSRLSNLLELCRDVLLIKECHLRSLPSIEAVCRQTFLDIASLKVASREERQSQALKLTKTYFSLPIDDQSLLCERYSHFISKLRSVPLQIKIILELNDLYSKVCKSLNEHSVQHSGFKDANESLHPNRVHHFCCQAVTELTSLSRKIQESQMENSKVQTPKLLFNSSDLNLYIWTYSSCQIAISLFMQRKIQNLFLNFVKMTNELRKIFPIDLCLICRLYDYFLGLLIEQQYGIDFTVYMQLEVQKLLKRNRFQIPENILISLSHTLGQTKEKHNSQFKGEYFEKGLNTFQKGTFPKEKSSIINSRVIADDQLKRLNVFQNLKYSKYKLKRFDPNQSTSLKNIKKYQLSLRKTAEKQEKQPQETWTKRSLHLSKEKSTHKKVPSTSLMVIKQTTTQEASNTNAKQTVQKTDKGKSQTQIKKIRGNPVKLKRRGSSINIFKNKTILFHSEQQKTPQAVYMAIRDKLSKNTIITSMALENEMFMIPDFRKQKPRITFQEILNDAKIVQQRESDSESFVNHYHSGSQLLKAQFSIEFVVLMNGRVYTFKVEKSMESNGQFFCQIFSNGFKNLFQFEDLVKFSFKEIKTAIEMTELFFQLMQSNIQSSKVQNCIKLVIEAKQLQDLENKNSHLYFSYVSCISTMLQIANFVKPAIYWYFSNNNKINGSALQKRKQMRISDPLKFSINLEFFKNNSFEECASLFKAVRNKKGLKECILYLAQGRSIISKAVVKRNAQHFFSVSTIHPKQMKEFEIDEQENLRFPFAKIRQTLYSLPLFEVVYEKKAYLSEILKNRDCNSVLIGNLNQNFINRVHVVRILQHFELEYLKSKAVDFELEQIAKRQALSEGYSKNYFPSEFYKGNPFFQIEQDELEMVKSDALSLRIANYAGFIQLFSEMYSEPNQFIIERKLWFRFKINSEFYRLEAFILKWKLCLLTISDLRRTKKWVLFTSQATLHSFCRLFDQRMNRALKQTDVQPNGGLLASIISDQSQFKLSILETAYNQKLAIKYPSKNIYLVNEGTRNSCKTHKFHSGKIILKKVLKRNKGWVYVCVSVDAVFFYWRIDFYDPKTQRKFVGLVPFQTTEDLFTQDSTQREIENSAEYSIWSSILNSESLEVDFEVDFVFRVNSNDSVFEALLFESFGSMSVVHSKGNNSGVVELIKHRKQVIALLSDFRSNELLKSEIQEDPYHLFSNLFSEFSQRESVHCMYGNLFIRVYQKIMDNKICLEETTIHELSQIRRFNAS